MIETIHAASDIAEKGELLTLWQLVSWWFSIALWTSPTRLPKVTWAWYFPKGIKAPFPEPVAMPHPAQRNGSSVVFCFNASMFLPRRKPCFCIPMDGKALGAIPPLRGQATQHCTRKGWRASATVNSQIDHLPCDHTTLQTRSGRGAFFPGGEFLRAEKASARLVASPVSLCILQVRG